MTILTLTQYQQLIRDAEIITEDFIGHKVLRLHDGKMLKLFRLKSWWSSALFFDYAKRFYKNSNLLKEKNIVTVDVASYFKIPSIKRTAVMYQPLSGANIRDIATRHQHRLAAELIARLGSFIAHLHNQGIYFRSLHLGNIILTTDNELGLIDIADMKIKEGSLSNELRLRNFKHLTRYDNDKKLLQWHENNVFWDSYFAACQPNVEEQHVGQFKKLG